MVRHDGCPWGPRRSTVSSRSNPDCAFPDAVQVLAREVLRLRRDCPPTAEVEKLRDDRDAWKHKADSLGADLNRIRSLVPTTCDEQPTFDAVFNRLQNLRAENEKHSYALRENAELHLHLSNIGSALREAGRPHRHKGDELERIRDLAGERDTLRNAEFRGQTGRVFRFSSAEWDSGDADGMPSAVGIYGTGDMGRGEAYYERRSAAFPRTGPATGGIVDAPVTDLQYDRAALAAEVEKSGIGMVPAAGRGVPAEPVQRSRLPAERRSPDRRGHGQDRDPEPACGRRRAGEDGRNFTRDQTLRRSFSRPSLSTTGPMGRMQAPADRDWCRRGSSPVGSAMGSGRVPGMTGSLEGL